MRVDSRSRSGSSVRAILGRRVGDRQGVARTGNFWDGGQGCQKNEGCCQPTLDERALRRVSWSNRVLAAVAYQGRTMQRYNESTKS